MLLWGSIVWGKACDCTAQNVPRSYVEPFLWRRRHTLSSAERFELAFMIGMIANVREWSLLQSARVVVPPFEFSAMGRRQADDKPVWCGDDIISLVAQLVSVMVWWVGLGAYRSYDASSLTLFARILSPLHHLEG